MVRGRRGKWGLGGEGGRKTNKTYDAGRGGKQGHGSSERRLRRAGQLNWGRGQDKIESGLGYATDDVAGHA